MGYGFKAEREREREQYVLHVCITHTHIIQKIKEWNS